MEVKNTETPEVVTKKERPIHHNKSIHKRVVNGFTMYPKKDTSKRKNPDTIKRVVQAIESHLEIHPRDRYSQDHLSKLKKLI